MNITELSVKRPVTTIMFFLGLIIMGFISLVKLPRELLPSLVYPQITVISVYENATPEEIERQVTKIVEETIGTVNNLKTVNSISREGLSMVIAEFNWGTNMDLASMDVREKIDLIKERLPRNAEDPVVMKFNPFELPVMTILLSEETGSTSPEVLYKMREVARKVIKTSLEKIEGVASVEIKGGREREIVVEVDQGRLLASGISLLEVVNILRNANLSYPAGTIKKRFYEYLIRTMGEFKDADDIRETPLKLQYYKGKREQFMDQQMEREKEQPKGMVFLKNIATVSDTFKERQSIFRHNGKESISIAIKKQSGSNVVKVVERIRKALNEMHHKLPSEYKTEVIYDQSEYIEQSIYGVAESAVLGGILAFLVLYLFLKNVRSSLIVTMSIPVSLMCTFILMYVQKISINMMSLGGLALGVGMLVDNSVVVLENIYRLNVLRPEEPQLNAIEGTTEVFGAITSSTLTTITVFLPFVFVSGVAGQLFKELAYTVTFSLITSLLVAVTLIPRLAAGVKLKEFAEPGWSNVMKSVFDRTLGEFLFKKTQYIAMIALFFVLSIVVILCLNKEFIPQTKQSQFVMKVALPPGTPLEITDSIVQKIEAVIDDIKEVKDITTSIGSPKGSAKQKILTLMEENEAEILITLQGKKGYAEYAIQKIKKQLSLQSLEAEIEYITQAGIFGSALSGSAPISVEIKGEDMKELIGISNEVEAEMSAVKEIYGVKKTFKGYRPEIRIQVNKDRASLYDISTQNVTITAQTAIKGYVATELKEQEEEIDIRVALRESDRTNFEQIGNIIVRSPLKIDVKLNQLASFYEEKSSSEIRRKEGQRIITVTANYIGAALSKVLTSLRARLERVKKVSREYTVEIAGEQEKMQESFKELMFVLVLSLLFVYMIMASQFESLWQPFIVIFTVPLSAIGVALLLMMTSTSLNVVVLLGITMLGGIVVNNGIVLISYFNLLKGSGQELEQMVREASTTRLRPVLMTALTTTLGLIPMAVSGGEGSELRAPLAVTVIGGLITSTFLTLYVLPAVYIVGEKFLKRYNFDWFKQIFGKISW
ncbi:MAG: efflux RND transporter permease subunit [Elusimicrobiota bacterium]